MKTGSDKKPTAFELDLRVRDRLLLAGILDGKALERHLAELPDLEGHYESLPYAQPALGDRDDRGGQ